MFQVVSEQVLGSKTYELCTHEERVNVWNMHTCEYTIGSNPHIFWVLLGLQSTNWNRLCEHGNSSNHKLCILNPNQITQSLSI